MPSPRNLLHSTPEDDADVVAPVLVEGEWPGSFRRDVVSVVDSDEVLARVSDGEAQCETLGPANTLARAAEERRLVHGQLREAELRLALVRSAAAAPPAKRPKLRPAPAAVGLPSSRAGGGPSGGARPPPAAVAQVTLGGLQGRSDLNGERAVVIGPCDAKGRVPVRVRSSGECVRARVANAFGRGDGELPTVLELGAGSGALSLALAPRLAGWATVVAVDDMSSRIRTMSDVEKLDHEAALRLHAPTLVLVSWMPSGVDFSGAIRACESVVEYVLLGEADSDTCGDGWATWGVMPDNGYEYGLDEDSVPPARQDGFERATLAACAACQVCRFDSAAGRGFSTTVAFTRRGAVDEGEALEAEDDGETLEQSWERMQRSLAAGRAERMAVEMEARVHEAAASDHESADLEGLERMAAALKAKMGSG